MNKAPALVGIEPAPPASTRSNDRPVHKESFNTTVHGLRGMAAFMVFIAHVLGGVGENVYPTDSSYLAVMQAPWNFGRWGVWLFFVISGYVILPSVLRYSPADFAVRRFFRLYPVFFAFSLLFLALNAFSSAFPSLERIEVIVPALLMVNLLTHTEQLTPNAWSLSYEVMFYVLVCLIVHFAVRRRNACWTVLLVAAAAMLTARYPAMAFFAAGIGVRMMEDRGVRVPERLLIPLEITTALGCLILGSLRHYTFELDELNQPGLYAIFAVTVAYFWVAIQPGSLTGRILDNPVHAYLGTVSYSLYLAHPYTYFAARQAFVATGLFGKDWLLSVGIFMLIVVPVTMAFTHIVYITLERAPYRWFFRQRVYHA